MSYFCSTCGTRIEDNAAFCPACGAAVTPPNNIANEATVSAVAPQQNYAPQTGVKMPQEQQSVAVESSPEKKGFSFKYLIIGIVALVLVVGTAVGIYLYKTLTAENAATDVAKAAMDAVINERDADGFIEQMHEGWCEASAEEADVDVDEISLAAQVLVDEFFEGLDNSGTTWSIEWETELSEDAPTYIEKDMKNKYDEYDIKVSQVKIVPVEYSITKGDSDVEEYDFDFVVVKIDGKWYADGENLSEITLS